MISHDHDMLPCNRNATINRVVPLVPLLPPLFSSYCSSCSCCYTWCGFPSSDVIADACSRLDIEQVDIVGTPERGGEWGVSGASPSSGGRGSSANSGNNGNNAGGGTNSAGSGINSANRRHRRRRVRGEGCCVETDPNASTLRALECINLWAAVLERNLIFWRRRLLACLQ